MLALLFSTKKAPMLLLGVLSATWLCLLPANAQAKVEISRTCKDANYWPEKAIPACSELLQNPQLSDEAKEKVYLFRSRANIKLSNWLEALADIDAVLAISPDNVNAWRWKARAHNGMEDYPAALEAAERVLSLDPDDEFGHHARYQLLQSMGREDREEIHLRQQLTEEPTNNELRRELGKRLLFQERYDEAADVLAPVVRSDPSDHKIRGWFLGSCHGAGNDCPDLFPGSRANRLLTSCERARTSLIEILEEVRSGRDGTSTGSGNSLLPNLDAAMINAGLYYISAIIEFNPTFSELSAKQMIASERLLRCYEEKSPAVSEKRRENDLEFRKFNHPKVRGNYLDLAYRRLENP